MSVPPNRVNLPIRVTLARSKMVVEVAADQSILQALAARGIYVDSVCREGICATCETRVISGVPDHRDRVIPEEERATSDTMMVCVSRAMSPELELDL